MNVIGRSGDAISSSILHNPPGADRVTAPYITAWSEEVDPPVTLVELPGRGIGYADESVTDRDRKGVLWFRTVHRPGAGRPEFGRVHPGRQRRAMLRLLCGVCGGPASQTDEGVLWVVRDFRGDWPGWPDGMCMDEPPVCVSCLALSVRVCPALRRGAAAFRVRQFPIAGVRGGLYISGPRLVGDTTVAYTDPASRWVRAASLVRQLHECTLVDYDELRTS